MTKKLTIAFCLCVIAISMFGMYKNHPELRLFIDISPSAGWFRIISALTLLAYALVPEIRNFISKLVIILGGAIMLVLAFFSVTNESLFGLSNLYLMPLDFFIAVEAGILFLLSAVEFKALTLKDYLASRLRQINFQNYYKLHNFLQ